ncbi:unnamed protein product [Owenia fusiformis]|uniref:Uncharacterized protein n=1 Tax=Owenia fusiformis TaxID=6347 RepID=A0A8J1TFM0_OWEFU|nr:unnamed protein product [Owenia fusiformis]
MPGKAKKARARNTTRHTRSSSEMSNDEGKVCDTEETDSEETACATPKGNPVVTDNVNISEEGRILIDRMECLSREITKQNSEFHDEMNVLRDDIRKNTNDMKNAFKEEISELKSGITYAQEVSEENKIKVEEHEECLKDIQIQSSSMSTAIKNMSYQYNKMYDELNTKLLDMNVYSRRSALHFQNIPEEDGENPGDVMKHFFVNRLKMSKDEVQNIRFERVHRIPLGPKEKYRFTRTMTVKFNWYQDRETVWGKRFSLKGSNIYVTESFPKEVEDNRRLLMPYFKKAKELKWKCAMIADTLIVKDERYKIGDIQKLPMELLNDNSSMRDLDTVFLYNSSTSPLGPDSCTPFECDGTMFRSVTQYLAYNRAIVMKDQRTADKVLQSSDPRQIRRLISEIRGSDGQSWRKRTDVRAMAKSIHSRSVMLKSTAVMLV